VVVSTTETNKQVLAAVSTSTFGRNDKTCTKRQRVSCQDRTEALAASTATDFPSKQPDSFASAIAT
jgi:hypothetical protein